MRRFYFAIAIMAFTLPSFAQVRYLEEVFTDVSFTGNLTYGVNATILYFPQTLQAVPEELVFDLYEPTGDTSSLRPLIIYFHTGNFLPYPNNQSVNGTKRDSTVVEMARRLSRMGYVVASADYRLGWNPVAATKDERVLTLINAAYRGVQDANTAIRYFKKTVVENGNPHRIDTSRIVLFGDGTGGYISLNTGSLDAYIKIPTASNGKFLLSDGAGNFFPMVLEGVNGDIEAKGYGIIPPGGIPFLPFPENDTLCYANHPEYSSDFAASVNLGGAIGDSAWVDPGQPPVISVHTPYDPFAPYKEGLVLVPVNPPLEVVEVQGSYLVSLLANQFGNNSVLNPTHATDFQEEMTVVANSRNDGLEGLYPIYGTGGPFDSAPWTFWDPASNVNSAAGYQTNPDMTREKAERYMDSIVAYVAPRLYTALDIVLSTENLLDPNEVNIAMYPNPVADEVFVSANKEYLIRSIDVYDLKGTLVSRKESVNHHFTYYRVNNLAPGQYVMKVSFDEGVTARQFVVK